MNVHTSKECGSSPVNGMALLEYEGSSMENPLSVTEVTKVEEADVRVAMTTNPAKCGNPESLCVTELHALRKMPAALAKPRTDITIHLPINYKLQTNDIVGKYSKNDW